MSNLFIVIVVYQIKSTEGTTTLLYDDKTEKFIQDPEVLAEGEVPPSTIYHNYLQSKFGKMPNCHVIKEPINVMTSVSLQELLIADAKEKLSLEELDALKTSLQNES